MDVDVSSRGGELAKWIAGRVLVAVGQALLALSGAAVTMPEEPVADGKEEVDFFEKSRCNDGRFTRRG